MCRTFGVGAVTASTASAFSWNAKSGYRQDGVAPTGLSSAYSFQKVGDRYYDPALLCFLTRDTELGELPYTYCNGDPVNCIDPDGHKTKKPPTQPDTGTGGSGGGTGGSGGSGGGGLGGGNAGTGGGTGSGGNGNVVADPKAGTLGVQIGPVEAGVTGLNSGKGPSGGYATGTQSSGQTTVQETATAGAGAKPGYSASYSYSLGGPFSIAVDTSGTFFFKIGR